MIIRIIESVIFINAFRVLKIMATCYLQNKKRLTDIENKLTVTKEESAGGGVNEEFGTNSYIENR